MKKTWFAFAVCMPTCVLLWGAFETGQAQFAFSPFAEGSVAYTALAGLGMNFSAANPAILNGLASGKKFAYTLEATENSIQSSFKDDFPDYCLQLAIAPRLTVAFVQSQRAAFTSALALRSGFALHPLEFLMFGYRQDWAIGLGYQIKPAFSAGLAMRHEIYTISPAGPGLYSVGPQYRTFDFGLRKTSPRFNFGLVFRNFIRDRTTQPFSQPLLIFVNPDSVIAWNPTSFPGIAFEPEFSLEGGVQWLISSHWQMLVDLTTRKEYALGMRWEVFSQFFLTAGTGKRYDRIYADEAATYNALGSQFHHANFSLAVTWIIPTRAGRTSFKQLPHGSYQLQQLTNHRLLIGGALSF